jgi:hypothetical protein
VAPDEEPEVRHAQAAARRGRPIRGGRRFRKKVKALYYRTTKSGLSLHLKSGLIAGLQGGCEAERLAEVVRGGGTRAAPPPVDEEGDRGGEV